MNYEKGRVRSSLEIEGIKLAFNMNEFFRKGNYEYLLQRMANLA